MRRAPVYYRHHYILGMYHYSAPTLGLYYTDDDHNDAFVIRASNGITINFLLTLDYLAYYQQTMYL